LTNKLSLCLLKPIV